MLRLKLVTANDESELRYIENLYVKSFPIEERRPFKTIRTLLRESSVYTLSLLCDEESPVGFISCWRWPDWVYVEHFAVDEAMRGSGYGGQALSALCGETTVPVVLEVEHPKDELSHRRIAFYRRAGFELVERHYVQPPYFEGACPLELYLMFYGLSFSLDTPNFDLFFATVRDRLHREVYKVEAGTYR